MIYIQSPFSGSSSPFIRPFSDLHIPEISIESLDEFSRWSLDVLNTILMFYCSKSRLWNLKYANLKYENDHTSAVPANTCESLRQVLFFRLLKSFLLPARSQMLRANPSHKSLSVSASPSQFLQVLLRSFKSSSPFQDVFTDCIHIYIYIYTYIFFFFKSFSGSPGPFSYQLGPSRHSQINSVAIVVVHSI